MTQNSSLPFRNIKKSQPSLFEAYEDKQSETGIQDMQYTLSIKWSKMIDAQMCLCLLKFHHVCFSLLKHQHLFISPTHIKYIYHLSNHLHIASAAYAPPTGAYLSYTFLAITFRILTVKVWLVLNTTLCQQQTFTESFSEHNKAARL